MNLEGRQGVWTLLENNKLQKVTPEGKGLVYWLLFVMFVVMFVTFQFGILGQVWYLIVSIPDPCYLSYFLKNYGKEAPREVIRPPNSNWNPGSNCCSREGNTKSLTLYGCADGPCAKGECLFLLLLALSFNQTTSTGWKRTQDIAQKWADVYTELGKKHTTKVRKSGISPI